MPDTDMRVTIDVPLVRRLVADQVAVGLVETWRGRGMPKWPSWRKR